MPCILWIEYDIRCFQLMHSLFAVILQLHGSHVTSGLCSITSGFSLIFNNWWRRLLKQKVAYRSMKAHSSGNCNFELHIDTILVSLSAWPHHFRMWRCARTQQLYINVVSSTLCTRVIESISRRMLKYQNGRCAIAMYDHVSNHCMSQAMMLGVVNRDRKEFIIEYTRDQDGVKTANDELNAEWKPGKHRI